MCDWMNSSQVGLAQIKNASRRLQPYAQSVRLVMTDEKIKRVLRAMGLAMLVLLAIFILGFIKIVQIAWLGAVEVFQQQLKAEVSNLDKAAAVEKLPLPVVTLPTAEVLTVKTGVRALRKVATQRGIRNASRMKKAELLARLEIQTGASALEG